MTPLGLLLGNTPNFTYGIYPYFQTYFQTYQRTFQPPQPYDCKDTATFYSLQIF